MSAENHRCPAIEEIPHSRFLRRGFTVYIHQNCVHRLSQPVFGQFGLHAGKRIVQRVHEEPRHEVEKKHLAPVAKGKHG